jgi:hypothetical protein
MRFIKNTIPTSFTIDLSTVDRKVDKLLKYFENCSTDLKDDSLSFVDTEVTYQTVSVSLKNRTYKENLSKLINDIYYQRFTDTRQKLISMGVATESDLLIPEPIDDFGSRFDAFAATNTEPSNLILKVLNVKPYKFLKVDIHDQEEITNYVNNVASASYDLNNLIFILNRLDNATNSYLNSVNLREYIQTLSETVFYVANEGAVQNQQSVSDFIFDLLEIVPSCNLAKDLMSAYSLQGAEINSKIFPSDTLSSVTAKYDESIISSFIGNELYENEKTPNGKIYNPFEIEIAKIKLLDFIIRTEIKDALQQKTNSLRALSEFNSKYTDYNFFEEKLFSGQEFKKIKKEQLFFKLTYLRETEEVLNENNENLFTNLNIEFVNKQNIRLESPFGSTDRNNKFIAIIGGSDIAGNQMFALSNFFEPTILSILSDLDYIDSNIFEIDPFFCPTPQSLQPETKIEREKYLSNQYVSDTIEKNKHFLDSNPTAFNYINFPDIYFIPNYLSGAMSFYESTKDRLTRNKANEIIKNHSKYYYENNSETPVSKILRDQNSNKLFKEALLNNGFYGLYEAKNSTFSDPFVIDKIVKQIDALGEQASYQIQDIIFARTNISCLLKEFQDCFMPKVANCKDVLRGFRFSELETILNKAFPESAYPELYSLIMQFKLNNTRDQKEKKLLQEIKDLERKIKNNERKNIIFREMDKRTEPVEALNIADSEIGFTTSNITLEDLYQQKLKEYRDLKLKSNSENLSIEERKQLENEMPPEELQMIDDFLNLLEQYGIDTSILCDMARLINDLLNTSLIFGTITLPELPEIDIFQETKLSIDLSIVKLIFDTIVSFIKKILEELTTCGGIKDLIQAALTGEASGSILGTGLAALNQMATGRFDLDDFVDNNPQIDPTEYAKSLTQIVNKLSNSVTLSQTSSLNINVDLGIAGSVSSSSKLKTVQVLSNPKTSAVTDIEIKNSLTGLIADLSIRLDPQRFINLIGGKGLQQDILDVVDYINEQRQELSYLANPNTIKNLFSQISKISGLDFARDQLTAVSSYYSNYRAQADQILCLDPSSTFSPSEADRADDILDIGRGATQRPSIEITPTDTYRQLLVDLLSCSPETIKQVVDEQIFKPLLLGMLPNGKKIPDVERAQKDAIKSSLKDISQKFKTNCNDFYSKLAYKKKVSRKIPKFIKQESAEEPKDYENPEYKDLITKGGYQEDSTPDSITVDEDRFIYGGVFSEYFYKSAETFSLESEPDSLVLSVNGSKGYSTESEEKYYNAIIEPTQNNFWKVSTRIGRSENNISLFEGNSQQQTRQVFSYKIINKDNVDTNYIYRKNQDTKTQFNNLLKNSTVVSFANTERNKFEREQNNFQDYISNSYDQDGLLQPINLDSLEKDSYIVGVKNGLDAIFPGFSNVISNENFFIKNPNIDTPLKYINFCPNPTKQQKDRNIDPGLYGKLELEQFIYQSLNKRQTDLVSLKNLQNMLADKDNTLKQSLVDGLYLSLIRTACAEICLRTIFILRTFKYDQKIVEDLLLPTFVSDIISKEINYHANSLNKESLVEFAKEHINHTHDFIFEQQLTNPEKNNLFGELNQLKKDIISLKEDKRILNSYIGKINIKSIKNESDLQYREKIQNYVSCLNKEIKIKEEEILKLQTRNIAYNEFIVMFDKLSYITSTNNKVKEELGENCSDDLEANVDQESFLNSLIPELLIDSELTEITTETRKVDSFVKAQELKFTEGPNLLTEHYIDVPLASNPVLLDRQNKLKIWGPTIFDKLINLLEPLKDNDLLSNYFSGEFKYAIRMIYVPSTELSREASIKLDRKIDDDPNMVIIKNFDKLVKDGKNKFFVNEIGYNFTDKKLSNSMLPQKINRLEKAYSLPFLSPRDENGDRRFGLINSFTIIEEKESISIINIKTAGQLRQFIEDLKLNRPNQLKSVLKSRISCSETLKQFYSILTNKNALSNIMILSSLNILGSTSIRSPFSTLRRQILTNIFAKICSIYNENDFRDLMEKISTIEFFKDFNADLIIKTVLKAAIYVLQYYCQMTDPNISTAMLIRNAVKLSLSAASQVASAFGENRIPSELPLALSPIALYSMAQLPINVFGVPPAGIGIGPPLTIPGFVLLGAELLLLSLEFSDKLDTNIDNKDIKEELRNYCFDLSGYKKYGIE